MIDSEFLASGEFLNDIELMAFWDLDNIDNAATYEVSRNGGNEYQTVTMERLGQTEIYRAAYKFVEESVNQAIQTQATKNGTVELNDTTQQRIGQLVTIANVTELREITLSFAKNGAPDGNIFVSITEDSSGDPGTVLAETNAIPISGLSAGDNVINIRDFVLLASTVYHVVIRTDQAY